jgi:HlyD family secretion protein
MPIQQSDSSSSSPPAKRGADAAADTKDSLSKQSNGQEQKPKSKKPFIILAIVAGLCGMATFGLYKWMTRPDPHKLFVSGRIEGYEVNVGAKIPGRVEEITVREGALVKPGDLLAQLSDDDIQAQLRGAQARVDKAIADKNQAERQIEVNNDAVEQAKLNKKQAAEDAEGQVLQAEANIAAAKAAEEQSRANLEEAEASSRLANIRKTRYEKLAERGAVTQDSADEAATNASTAAALVEARRASVAAAHKQYVAALGALKIAKAVRLNPPIRQQQISSSQHQVIQSAQALESAEHAIKNAKAEVDQIAANIAYLKIESPVEGTVTARAVEPGAVVTAGQTILSIIDLQKVYLRGYVPEGEIGRVRVGQKTNIYLDSAPEKAISGKIIEIDPKASFTPENIYFRDDRVKQVFGLKIGIDNPAGFAKPGMPADAEILVEDAK